MRLRDGEAAFGGKPVDGDVFGLDASHVDRPSAARYRIESDEAALARIAPTFQVPRTPLPADMCAVRFQGFFNSQTVYKTPIKN